MAPYLHIFLLWPFIVIFLVVYIYMDTITSILLIIDSIQERDKNFEQAVLKSGHQISTLMELSQLETIGAFSNELLVNYEQNPTDLLIANVEQVSKVFIDKLENIFQAHPLPIIIFTPDKTPETMDYAIKAGISAYIVDGFQANRIGPIISIAISRFKVVNELQSQLQQTKQRLNDRKLIDKAKGILMQEKHLNEEQAYNLLRKTAMNKSCSMAAVAGQIIEFHQLMKSG